MKKSSPTLKKNFISRFKEYLRLFFESAAENHIRIAKSGQGSFRSYSQLKKTQKKIRTLGIFFFVAVLFLILGFFGYPLLFSTEKPTELYVPNGKGDILIGNISKNKATVVFKTLDAANGNKPLATRAAVAIYGDSQYKDFIRVTDFDDYAVTHIIPLDGLLEEQYVYLKLMAKDVPDKDGKNNSITITSWGNGDDPIKIFATGQQNFDCFDSNSMQNIAENNSAEKQKNMPEINSTMNNTNKYLENRVISDSEQQKKLDAPNISEIDQESYLYQNNNTVQTIISWKTNVPSSTSLVYHEENSKEEKEIFVSDEKTTKHTVVTMTLLPGKVYYFRAKSQEEDGTILLSQEYSLKTPRPKENALQIISSVFSSFFK